MLQGSQCSVQGGTRFIQGDVIGVQMDVRTTCSMSNDVFIQILNRVGPGMVP